MFVECAICPQIRCCIGSGITVPQRQTVRSHMETTIASGSINIRIESRASVIRRTKSILQHQGIRISSLWKISLIKVGNLNTFTIRTEYLSGCDSIIPP